MRGRYMVTRLHNAESQHWRGLLRGYVFTRASHVHMHAQGCAWVCVHACVSGVRINT